MLISQHSRSSFHWSFIRTFNIIPPRLLFKWAKYPGRLQPRPALIRCFLKQFLYVFDAQSMIIPLFFHFLFGYYFFHFKFFESNFNIYNARFLNFINAIASLEPFFLQLIFQESWNCCRSRWSTFLMLVDLHFYFIFWRFIFSCFCVDFARVLTGSEPDIFFLVVKNSLLNLQSYLVGVCYFKVLGFSKKVGSFW